MTPLDEEKGFFEVAKQQPTKTAAFEARDRTAVRIERMEEYVRQVSAAIRAGDLKTFEDPKKELVFARGQVAGLKTLLAAIDAFLA